MMKSIDLRRVNWYGLNSGGSIGMLPKTTIDISSERNFVKMSSYSMVHGVYGIESISEVMASRIARILRINCVYNELYDALVIKNNNLFRTYVCISKDYTSGRTVIPFEDSYIKHRKDKEITIEYMKRLGNKIEMYKMFIFDYIINNMDRHGANVELFENGRMGSLFDNGSSLYAYTEESKIRGKYYGDDMEVNNFIGSRSLLSNIKQIDCELELGELKQEHRAVIFKDLGSVISRARRDTIWEHIIRRHGNVRKICNIRTIR